MAKTRIVTLDLNFQGRPLAIASFLVRQGDAVVLIESGPGSTLSALEAGLAKEGLTTADVTHVLLTHIHLDHAGAAGWLAKRGAEIYVHPIGAPHLLNPEKLIASAGRIYGDRMETLWGEILPVPENQLKIPNDAEKTIPGVVEVSSDMHRNEWRRPTPAIRLVNTRRAALKRWYWVFRNSRRRVTGAGYGSGRVHGRTMVTDREAPCDIAY